MKFLIFFFLNWIFLFLFKSSIFFGGFAKVQFFLLNINWFALFCFSIVPQVALLLLLALCNAIKVNAEESNGQCDHNLTLDPRPHSVSILEFGAVADGKTLNTIAFQNAIFYLKSFADKGGAQLYVPPGRWLTGSFNLTSHLTLFLEKGAVILGSQVVFCSDFFAHISICFSLVLRYNCPIEIIHITRSKF